MATTLSATSSSATSLSSSSTAPLTVSRRVLRKTLNEALAIAGNAVQLDSAGDYVRSIEAYQRSVELLDYGIALMKLQRDAGGERPGRDTSHEIAQLEQIREKYKSRIHVHRVERSRKAALTPKDSHHSSSASTSSSRRPRTPQSASIPPPQPPPTAPLPPIPTVINSPPEEALVLQTTRKRGASLPSNQNQNQPQNHHHQPQQAHHHHESPKSPPDTATASEASTSADVNVRSPRTPPTPNKPPQTIQLNAIPLPQKRAKSSSRPQTAPGPAAQSLSNGNINGPLRVRTTSGATAPKRSNSSTALHTSTSQSSLNGRLNPPPPSNPPPLVRQAFLSPSPISPSKRADLIPLKKLQVKADVIPAFVTIFGLEPATKVTATAPPPKPTDPHRHPYHLLRLLLSTLNPIPSPSKANSNSQSVAAGGFITPKLYVPSSLWHQPDLWTLLLDLQEKVRLLETLKEALRTVHESSVILFGPMIFSSLRAPAKLKKSASTENTQFARSGMSQLDDPIEWLNALEKLASTLTDLEKSASKKLGLRENGASVKKRMMDWSTRVAKKTMGGKAPSGELMDAYVDALSGVCNFGPMLDAHFCALRTVVPTARAGPLRRPTISRNPTSEGPIAKPLSPQTPGSANGTVPDFSTDPDVLPPAITQLVPKYSALPKFVNTQAVTHLEKTTKIFSSFILPIILRDLAVLIEGLQEMRNGEWMGIQL